MVRKYDSRKRRKVAEQTRIDILEAALKLHWEGITEFEPLAREAGCSVATLRKYFPNKEVLYQNCTRAFAETLNMPDLDFLFGIGPQLIIKLINEPGQRKLNLNLQARAIYSTDFSSLDHRGFVFNPKLSYSLEHVSDLDLGLSTSIGPVFGTERLMDYFYEVKPEYATSSRQAYDADAGYLGTNIGLGISKRFDRSVRLILGARLGVHNGATNDDSPLFKDKVNVSVFTAFAWTFFQSEERAR